MNVRIELTMSLVALTSADFNFESSACSSSGGRGLSWFAPAIPRSLSWLFSARACINSSSNRAIFLSIADKPVGSMAWTGISGLLSFSRSVTRASIKEKQYLLSWESNWNSTLVQKYLVSKTIGGNGGWCLFCIATRIYQVILLDHPTI